MTGYVAKICVSWYRGIVVEIRVFWVIFWVDILSCEYWIDLSHSTYRIRYMTILVTFCFPFGMKTCGKYSIMIFLSFWYIISIKSKRIRRNDACVLPQNYSSFPFYLTRPYYDDFAEKATFHSKYLIWFKNKQFCGSQNRQLFSFTQYTPVAERERSSKKSVK